MESAERHYLAPSANEHHIEESGHQDVDRMREELVRIQDHSKPSRFQFDDQESIDLHAEMTKNIELHNQLIRSSGILQRIQQQNTDILDFFLLSGCTPNSIEPNK